ncbi:GNAT family N-acetyltransferase [Bradyrhizobium sp. 2TAF24]|uniref:GNAT family N-acetyltransferase n=1 Tax=Bradyrhizobium sp. 2TAF24 TaxID=3233011 RepID=UPI003F8FE95E
MRLDIRWCDEPARAQELAEFFASHVTPAYISHSELQGRRAIAPTRWRDKLPDVIRAELQPRLTRDQHGIGAGSHQPVLVTETDDGLVALALVTFATDAPIPFATVEDLIVAPSERAKGIGTTVIEWIAAEARERRIRRLFLESGVHNERAHHFFERSGFEICSVVMMRSL